MNTDKAFNDTFDALCKAGWLYIGCDKWGDPQTKEEYMTSVAYKVMAQRAKAMTKGKTSETRKPRLINPADWRGTAQELRRQLKPFGLTVKTRSVSLRHGGFLEWQVVQIVKPEYEKYLRDCNERGIDPWNMYA